MPEVTLPLPPRACSPNASCHWAVKGQAVREYRQQAWAACKEAKIGPLKAPVTVHLDFYLCRKHCRAWTFYFPRDAYNAAASTKAAQDGLVDAGIVPADSAQYLRVGTVTLRSKAKDHQGRTCLVVRLEEASE